MPSTEENYPPRVTCITGQYGSRKAWPLVQCRTTLQGRPSSELSGPAEAFADTALRPDFSLCPILPPSVLFNGCWSQEQCLRNFPHIPLHIRECFPENPTCNTHWTGVRDTGREGGWREATEFCFSRADFRVPMEHPKGGVLQAAKQTYVGLRVKSGLKINRLRLKPKKQTTPRNSVRRENGGKNQKTVALTRRQRYCLIPSVQTPRSASLVWEVKTEAALEGSRAWNGAQRGLWGSGMFPTQVPGTGVVTLWKFTELYSYELCTSLYKRYTLTFTFYTIQEKARGTHAEGLEVERKAVEYGERGPRGNRAWRTRWAVASGTLGSVQ